MLDQRVDGALGRRIGRQRADRGVRGQRGEQDDAAALTQNRQQLLHEEERRPDVDGEQLVELLDGGVFDRRRSRGAGVGDEDVEPVADDLANLGCQAMRRIRGREVGPDSIGLAVGGADQPHDLLGLGGGAAVMNDHPGALLGELERGGTAHAARGAGDESGLT